jgi:hypothetical protein
LGFLRSGPSSRPAPSRESSPSRGSPFEGIDLPDRSPPSGNCFLSGIDFPVDLSPSWRILRPEKSTCPGKFRRQGIASDQAPSPFQGFNPVQVNRSRDLCLYLGAGAPFGNFFPLWILYPFEALPFRSALLWMGIKTREVRLVGELLPVGSEPPVWAMKHRPGEVSFEEVRSWCKICTFRELLPFLY